MQTGIKISRNATLLQRPVVIPDSKGGISQRLLILGFPDDDSTFAIPFAKSLALDLYERVGIGATRLIVSIETPEMGNDNCRDGNPARPPMYPQVSDEAGVAFLYPLERDLWEEVKVYANSGNILEADKRAIAILLMTIIDGRRREKKKDDELKTLRRIPRGEVWYWQDDETNQLASLTCPVIIDAEKLRAIIDADPLHTVEASGAAISQEDREYLTGNERGHWDKYAHHARCPEICDGGVVARTLIALVAARRRGDNLNDKLAQADIQIKNLRNPVVDAEFREVDELKVGDVVQLKSGGPRMTVTFVADEGSIALVHCSLIYTNNEEVVVNEVKFPADCLKLVGR